jgi:hypothetical protein
MLGSRATFGRNWASDQRREGGGDMKKPVDIGQYFCGILLVRPGNPGLLRVCGPRSDTASLVRYSGG